MTEENYKYRTSDLFLRNQFNGVGKFDIPEIPKSNFSDDTLENLLLIGFVKINTDKVIMSVWCIFSYMITSLKIYGKSLMSMWKS